MVNDMTRGKPAKILMVFMLPMLLGNIFQQLYNIVDTVIVGNYVGADALAAVGSTAAMVFLLVAVAMGLSMGYADRPGRIGSYLPDLCLF